MEIKIEIRLDSGKRIRLSESEYEELRQKFEKTISIPYPYRPWPEIDRIENPWPNYPYPYIPNYPIQPHPPYWYHITWDSTSTIPYQIKKISNSSEGE